MVQKTRARIIGTGSYAPPRRLTNADFEKMVDTSDEWITSRTGIKERRIADDGSPPADTPEARSATDFLLQDWEVPHPCWTVEAAGEFRTDPGHINFGEAEAGAMTLRVAITKHDVSHCRVLIGGDNTASLHAFHKGRSSSWRLNAVCRRVAAMCFVADVSVGVGVRVVVGDAIHEV